MHHHHPVYTLPDNQKTGRVPTVQIGADLRQIGESCTAVNCSLRPKGEGGEGGCYARSGRVAIYAARAAGKPPKYTTLKAAIDAAPRATKMVRLGSIGDPATLSGEVLSAIFETAKAAGLAVVGYTHGWRLRHAARLLRGQVMASAETMTEADAAVDLGWRAAVIVPSAYPRVSRTPAGRTVVVCPAQLTEAITCNVCRLCDASRPGPVIAFRAHGSQRKFIEGRGTP